MRVSLSLLRVRTLRTNDGKRLPSRLQERFHSLEIRFPNYSAVLELMTTNTYVMAIIADPNVQNATIRMNIKLARERFEELASAE